MFSNGTSVIETIGSPVSNNVFIYKLLCLAVTRFHFTIELVQTYVPVLGGYYSPGCV